MRVQGRTVRTIFREKANRRSHPTHSLASSTMLGAHRQGGWMQLLRQLSLADMWFRSFFCWKLGLFAYRTISLKVFYFEENARVCWRPQLGHFCLAMLHQYPHIIFSPTQCPKQTGLACLLFYIMSTFTFFFPLFYHVFKVLLTSTLPPHSQNIKLTDE